MVYARKFRQRKMFNRKSPLTTRRIFNNKGAKAQAAQINALKKRITNVARKCRPETKVVESNTMNYGFTVPGITGTVQYTVFPFPIPVTGIQSSTSDNGRIGDLVTMYPSDLFLTMQYEEIYNSLISGFSTTKIPLPTSSIQARVVIIQAKIADQETPDISDVFDLDGYVSQQPMDAQMMMRMPFVKGITTKFAVVSDNVYNVSHDKGQLSIRKSLKPVIKQLRWFEGSGVPRGRLYMFVLSSGWSKLSYDSGEVNTDDYNKLNFTFRVRTPYTDA
jgi:hypothetical protein